MASLSPSQQSYLARQGLKWKIRLKRNKKWSKPIFPFIVLLLVWFFNCLRFALSSPAFSWLWRFALFVRLVVFLRSFRLHCFGGLIWGFICSRGFICIVFALCREVYDPLLFLFMMLCFYRWHCMLLCDVHMFEYEVFKMLAIFWEKIKTSSM